MDLSDFSLLKEDEHSYTVGHPKGRSITVPKEGLSDKSHAMIKKLKPQHFDEGGEVQADSIDDSPEEITSDAQAQESPQEAPAETQSATPVDQFRAPASVDPVQAKVGINEGAYEQEKAANNAEANAISSQGAAEANAIQGVQKQVDALPTQKDILANYKTKGDNLMQAYQDQKIDPNRLMNNMSTGNKIAAAISLILGGAGAGTTHQQSYAYEALHNAINNDIEAQKNDQSKSMNLWKMNQQAYGNEAAANLATQDQLYTGLKFKLEQAAAQAKSPMAKAQAMRANAVVDQKINENRLKLSLFSPSNDLDPAARIGAMEKFGLATPEQAKASLEEVKNAENIGKNGNSMLEAFDQAAREQRTFGGAGAIKNAKNMLPGVNSQGVASLHQAILPNFKGIDGTVRQAAMDQTFKDVTPEWGDSDEKVAQKRDALIKWMHSEASAPTTRSIGIDLSKYPSTSVKPTPGPQDIKTMNGVKYQKVQGGWKKIS